MIIKFGKFELLSHVGRQATVWDYCLVYTGVLQKRLKEIAELENSRSESDAKTVPRSVCEQVIFCSV